MSIRLADSLPHLLSIAVALLVSPVVARPLASQQPETVTLTGTVVDSTNATAINGALVIVGDRGPSALTDAQGRFTLANVPTGAQRLRAYRFGYRQLDRTIDVIGPMAPLDLRLEPDPLQLQGITVGGNARGDISGIVRDARSEQPVAWVDLTLTEDAVHTVGRREVSDVEGEFEISNIRVGSYLLRVERLGYVSQYVPVSHTVPTEPLDVRLDPDTVQIAGLVALVGALERRQDAWPRSSMVIDEEPLRLSALPSMTDYLQFSTGAGAACTSCSIYIDDQPTGSTTAASVTGRSILNSYSPGDFYRIEIFLCRGGRGEVHAYTHEYIQRMVYRVPRERIPIRC
jgi:hypothetical protein